MNMPNIRFGRTGLLVEKNGFGALPIQRISLAEASHLLQKAVGNGMNYIDTARSYSDSEEKIGAALAGMRSRFILATKTPSKTADGFWADLETSLRLMKTDVIDVYQFHNPAFLPRPGQDNGLYDAMLEARRQGKIRYIGITNHRLKVALEAVESGLYDVLQFPFSYLADEQDLAVVEACRQSDVGFVAMKALSGGLISNSRAACAYLNQFDNVLPIWGVQRERELDDFLHYIQQPPDLGDEEKAAIAADRKQLIGGFCRGCGYCLPCPAGIDIPTMARMSLLLRRAPVPAFTTPEMKQGMERVDACIHCRHCANHCPYGLDTPALLRANLLDFREFVLSHQL